MNKLEKISLSEVLNKDRFKKVSLLSLPILGGMISQNILNLVDTAMIGRIGAKEIAAVGIASIFLWMLTSLLQGFSSAVQALTARRLGEKNESRFHEAIVNAIYICLFAGIPYMFISLIFSNSIFHLLSSDKEVIKIGLNYLNIRILVMFLVGMNFSFRGYFNGLQKPKLYLQSLLMMHITNLFLNWVLIYGNLGFPRMETKGAAIASAVSVVVAILNYIRLIFKTKNKHFNLSISLIKKETVISLVKLAIPMCLQGLFMSGAFMVFFRLTSELGTNELAATNILINLALTFVLPSMALGMSVISLVGKSIGEGEKREAKLWSYSTALVGFIILGLVGFLVALFSEQVIQVFIYDKNVIKIAIIPLIILSLGQGFDSIGVIAMHVLLGGGEQKAVMKYSILSQWVLFLPVCAIGVLYFKFSLVFMFLAMTVQRLLLAFLFVREFYKNKWLENKI